MVLSSDILFMQVHLFRGFMACHPSGRVGSTGDVNSYCSPHMAKARRTEAPCGGLVVFRKRCCKQAANYLASCLAISSAKFSCFFSMPSPFSKRTAAFSLMEPPCSLATLATYCSTLMELSFTNSCCSRQFSS